MKVAHLFVDSLLSSLQLLELRHEGRNAAAVLNRVDNPSDTLHQVCGFSLQDGLRFSRIIAFRQRDDPVVRNYSVLADLSDFRADRRGREPSTRGRRPHTIYRVMSDTARSLSFERFSPSLAMSRRWRRR